MKNKLIKSTIAVLTVAIAFTAFSFGSSALQTNASTYDAVVESTAPTEDLPEQVADYPQITRFENVKNGTKISWSKYDGAQKYGIFVLKGSTWKALAITESLSYTHNSLSDGTKYTYTVRAMDSNKKYISSYNKQGYENVYYAPPVVTSLTNNSVGVNVKWNNQIGVDSYRIYRKSGNSGWARIGESSGNSFTDKNASSGVTYSYTVRCLDSNKNTISAYNNGKSIKYVKAPAIQKIENTATGSKITWAKSSGASKYRLYYLNSANEWKSIGTTTSTSLTHDNLKTGTTYTYTVRCLDSKGNFVSGFDKAGTTNIFITTPKISSLTNVYGGVSVKWGKLSGASSYRIYRKSGNSGWARIGESNGTSFTDKNASSGVTYSYTVRCLDSNKNTISAYNNGKSIKYVKAPAITKIENTATGSKISWTKSSGASKYRLYYLNSANEWKSIGTTTSTSLTHDKLKTGTTYTYTVRCLGSKGNFVSSFDKTGTSNLFLAPPKISSITKANEGNLISWASIDGAAGYRLYRKTIGSSWKKVADVTDQTSYIDMTVKSGEAYAYTLRCLDENGALISYYVTTAKFYIDGKLANGNVKIDGKNYYFDNGTFRSGFQTINGKKYYYDSNGNLQKNGIVGSSKDGWYYADKNGAIDYKYCNVASKDGKDWNVINGKATMVKTESDRTLYRALKVVAKITDKNMTKSEKLKVCFDYVKSAYTEKNPRIPHYHGSDWPIIYANDMFVDGAGNCFSYGSAFAYMAKAIGYEKVYCCNSGGHGWAEIDGLVYDPEWSRHNFKYSYYALSYNAKTDVNYKAGIAPGYSWMHVKI